MTFWDLRHEACMTGCVVSKHGLAPNVMIVSFKIPTSFIESIEYQ